MGIQLGMLLNFMDTTSTIVDHAGADLWIAARGVPSVDLATPIEERWRFEALAVAGVAKAESYLVHFGFLKRGDGVRQIIIIVGVDPDAEMGLPKAMTPGQSVHDALTTPDGIIIDRLYAKKLGVSSINQTVEINGHRARVAGFTDGIRTFTQSPYVFTSLRNARAMLNLPDKEIAYVLIRVAEGDSPQSIATALSARIPDVEIMSAGEFSFKSEYLLVVYDRRWHHDNKFIHIGAIGGRGDRGADAVREHHGPTTRIRRYPGHGRSANLSI